MKKNDLYMISGMEYKEMTKEILAQSDLWAEIKKKADQKQKDADQMLIGIKPNLVSPTEASYGATTHPEIVAGIIEYLQERSCQHIVMLESSWVGDKTSESMEVCGYDRLVEKYNVPFWDMQLDESSEVDCAGMKLQICSSVRKLDFLINVPVLKGHCQTKITCALKNMKGLIPNKEKRHFHKLGLHKPIAHLNVGIHQDFIVVDNICGDLDFEDGGNPVVMNRILTAKDPVLCDTFVCQMLYYRREDVPYLVMAEELGVGSADLEHANLIQIRFEKGTKEEEQGSEETASGKDINRKAKEVKDIHKTVWKGWEDVDIPRERKIVELQDAVEEVESCSACYGYLIPALDMVGKGFEKGTVFLPQLLMSADAAKIAFAVIKDVLAQEGGEVQAKNKVILATVKGDIHDIGKNIVKVLLENYSFDVIDLGKDVPPEVIVDTAVEQDIRLVGLSALMTTTVVSMEETIKLLRERKPECKVMVGGAVLNQDYADMIGADFYGKDAMQSVYYAQRVFGEE